MKKSSQINQQGAILVVALLFLLIMTILGVSGMSSSFMEEKMVGNSLSREKAFQAAEGALRYAENWLAESGNKDTILQDICGTAVDTNDPCNAAYDASQNDAKNSGDDLGDACTDGYCTPREQDWNYDKSAPHDCSDAAYIPERWESCPSGTAAAGNNLNLFVDGSVNYKEYDTEIDGTFQKPRLIIEFLGYRIPDNAVGACDLVGSDGVNDTPPESAHWPFCDDDPAYFRVTALGYGGTANTRVMLQSTVVVN